MCGDQTPDYCQNAMQNCFSAECVKDSVKEVFNNRFAQNSVAPELCSENMNFMVTPHF